MTFQILTIPPTQHFFSSWPENRPFCSETTRRPYQSLWQPGREARELTHLAHWTLIIDFGVPTTPRSLTISINSVRIPCTRSEPDLSYSKDLLTKYKRTRYIRFPVDLVGVGVVDRQVSRIGTPTPLLYLAHPPVLSLGFVRNHYSIFIQRTSTVSPMVSKDCSGYLWKFSTE